MTQITVTYDSGEAVSYPLGVKALDVLVHEEKLEPPLVAVLVDNELKSLDTELESDCMVRPVLADSAPGALVYRRSLCFLLAIASRELFPERRLIAGMAIGTGFYHYYFDEIPLTEEQVGTLAARIGDLVAMGHTDSPREVALGKGLRLFRHKRTARHHGSDRKPERPPDTSQ